MPKPENFGEPLLDSDGEKITNGEFFLQQEVEIFKFLKEKKIPVIFCIARSESVENGYKYLRKFFGDLILIPEISNYVSNEENWKAEDQWICNKWTRGTLLQLKDDNNSGLFGLVRLLTCIQDLYENNDEYKQRLPESFKDNDQLNDKFNDLFTALKGEILEKEWNRKNFANDDITGPLRSKNNNKDMISEIFEKPLIESLEQTHKNSWSVKTFSSLSKEILNLVCAYDYSVNNNQIAEEVVENLKKSKNLFTKGVALVAGGVAEKIIKMSLPNKEKLKDL